MALSLPFSFQTKPSWEPEGWRGPPPNWRGKPGGLPTQLDGNFGPQGPGGGIEGRASCCGSSQGLCSIRQKPAWRSRQGRKEEGGRDPKREEARFGGGRGGRTTAS